MTAVAESSTMNTSTAQSRTQSHPFAVAGDRRYRSRVSRHSFAFVSRAISTSLSDRRPLTLANLSRIGCGATSSELPAAGADG